MENFDFESYGITPDPGLGQNFLVDKTLIEEEVELLSLSREDSVFEIGPGMGWVTERVLPRCGSMTVMEKDRRFEGRLSGLAAAFPNLRILWADALESDFPPFTKILSNLPFRIALPLTFKILERNFTAGALVFQKRLADRICAESGEDHFCRITVQIRRLADARLARVISPDAFVPRPAVQCALLLVKKRVKFDVPDEAYFKRVLDFLFFRRDSRCRDVLAGLFSGGERVFRSCMSELGAAGNAAVKTLGVRDFGLITRVLHANAVDVPVIPDDLKRVSQKINKGEGYGGHQRYARPGDGSLQRNRPGHREGARPPGREPPHRRPRRG
jgi:16S rRNA (adenine1518-N6/adenine1519-N6)-dimethyltransferase